MKKFILSFEELLAMVLMIACILSIVAAFFVLTAPAGAQEPTATPAPAWCCQCTMRGAGGFYPFLARMIYDSSECFPLCYEELGCVGTEVYSAASRYACGVRCISRADVCVLWRTHLPLVLK